MNTDRLFHVVEEMQVILCRKGTYHQAKVYSRQHGVGIGHRLYAKVGGGFVQLQGRNGTSEPNVSWIDIEEGPSSHGLVKGKFGEPLLPSPP